MTHVAPPAPGFTQTVVHLATEYWPYARTGGLGEAVRGIARYQARSGVPTVAILPLHREIRRNFPWIERMQAIRVPMAGGTERARLYRAPAGPDAPEIWFIDHDAYFNRPGLYGEDGATYPDNHVRFAFFCRAALEALPHISPGPTIVHAHDWHTALALVYLRTTLADVPYLHDVASVMTVHNAGFQGYYPPEVLDQVGVDQRWFHWRFLEWHGQVNLLKGALVCADMVTTVSPTHAGELRTPGGGFGLHGTFNALGNRFVGILNGIELDVWDPANDAQLPAPYSPEHPAGKEKAKAQLQHECRLAVDPHTPLFGLSARLTRQKGIDLILAADILSLPAQWIFLGEGDRDYQARLAEMALWAPDRVAVRFDFREEFEHRLLGGADMLLMPSLYEPCGITQMRAEHYGALPVARRVGGLADTIVDGVTGFLFDEYEPAALRSALEASLTMYARPAAWARCVKEAMSQDFGWSRSVTEYHEVYRHAIARRAERPALPLP